MSFAAQYIIIIFLQIIYCNNYEIVDIKKIEGEITVGTIPIGDVTRSVLKKNLKL